MDSLFTSSPYPSPSPTDIGDYVMMESCIDNGCVSDRLCYESARPSRSKQSQRRRKLKEFPPPLTMLAMTENHRPHMPFVMRRFTTDDGRLVIVEEKVRHHDYIRITRSEGRLVLDLVAVEEREIDDVEERESDDVEEREIDVVGERESDLCNVVARNEKRGDEVEERESDDVEERESAEASECCNVAIRSVGKCYDYMRVRSSPCLFTMTMPTVRPVHI